MQWIDRYQLFLFDFDGLLVNTEALHQKAYFSMCQKRGFHLDWDFQRYCLAAHFDATGLRDQIYQALPELHRQEPDWQVLYKEKKQLYVELVEANACELMPGVAQVLETLQKRGLKRCVVTHSPLEHIQKIRAKHPLLESIPHWFTRDDYKEAKPHPECYQKAIATLGSPEDRKIGFEDTPRGLSALKASGADAVLVSNVHYPQMAPILEGTVAHFHRLDELCH